MALDSNILISAACAVPAPTNAKTEILFAMAIATTILMVSSSGEWYPENSADYPQNR
jgi:hypothetical protein